VVLIESPRHRIESGRDWPDIPAFRKVPALAPAVPSGRSDYRRFRRAIECSGRRGIRKFDGQFPKRGGLACARSNRSCPQVWAASFLGAGHDRVITSAIRGVVSQHPGIPTVL